MKALGNQVSGQKIIYQDEHGAVCKQACGNELIFYQRCQNEEKLKPFIDVTPRMLEYFQLRKDVDRIDLVIDGVLIDTRILIAENAE